MAITNTNEWSIEAAWLAVLAASTDLLTLLGSSTKIRRAYDVSSATEPPAITVFCPGAYPQLERGDGYYDAPVDVSCITSMEPDGDSTGQVRAMLAAGVRDVFENPGTLAAMEAAVTGLRVEDIQEPDAPMIYDDAGRRVRVYVHTYLCRTNMTSET